MVPNPQPPQFRERRPPLARFRNVGPRGVVFSSDMAHRDQIGQPARNPTPFQKGSASTPSGLGSVLERNIRVLQQRRLQEAQGETPQERLADAITRFTGSMTFVYLHLASF